MEPSEMWCADCGDIRVFEPIPDGVDGEHACVTCDTAVLLSPLT